MLWRNPWKIVGPISHLIRHWHVSVTSATIPLSEDAGHDKEEDERESDGEWNEDNVADGKFVT